MTRRWPNETVDRRADLIRYHRVERGTGPSANIPWKRLLEVCVAVTHDPGATRLVRVFAHDRYHVAEARRLVEAYAGSLEIDLSFQQFDAELRTFPSPYVPPKGAFFVAMHGPTAAGCVAMRRLEEGICEMKRLYVCPTFRGSGTGRMLARAIIDEARAAGYERMRLDTLASMDAALTLYQRLGFTEIGAYYDNPFADAKYLELRLR